MKVNISYAENIIVAVRFKDRWCWYVTEKEYWFMDLIQWENAFLDKGYPLPNQGDYSERFNIPILDEGSAGDFLHEIREFQVSTNKLREGFQKAVEMNTDLENDLLEYIPALFVDFDHRRLWSMFPEPASFECYVPEGWTGKYEDFLEKVPARERYWWVNGTDYFLKM
ncbi:hypothetical protein DCC85_04140 [Paenibacillus sp. CAA11]|uniref:hypothetical protein n=1 Tax=Paenibacillus sp. CAA11 TaxID=1532905 RepID=UPI000D3BC7C2|nr:hypothetical protein [Paenibacillus sp. CAA11]AWB43490.1 hypothetical protein DCC85_04140 [Paenibacillus sp. CAA11]